MLPADGPSGKAHTTHVYLKTWSSGKHVIHTYLRPALFPVGDAITDHFTGSDLDLRPIGSTTTRIWGLHDLAHVLGRMPLLPFDWLPIQSIRF